jgi:hypothetical protein
MEKEILEQITETIEGYPVKELAWLKRDNVIRGRVKDPVTGRDSLHDGYVTILWNNKGKVINRYGGSKRSDLSIEIKLITNQ